MRWTRFHGRYYQESNRCQGYQSQRSGALGHDEEAARRSGSGKFIYLKQNHTWAYTIKGKIQKLIQLCLYVSKDNTIAFNWCHDRIKPPENCCLKTSSRMLIISDKNCIVCQSQLLTNPWCLLNEASFLKSILPHTKSTNCHSKWYIRSSLMDDNHHANGWEIYSCIWQHVSSACLPADCYITSSQHVGPSGILSRSPDDFQCSVRWSTEWPFSQHGNLYTTLNPLTTTVAIWVQL